MQKQYIIAFLLLVAAASWSAEIHQIDVDGIINPVSSKFIIEAVDRAEEEGAEALIINLDTPGGLLEATRDVVQRFLGSEVPVVVYVSPKGARAGSAGVFITLAAHIAVMAPGTNIGAAHPVTVGGGMPGQGGEQDTTGKSAMSEKITNDAAAMIRSIAEQRGRNIEWAESAVRTSESITASQAVELNVIDFIAEDVDEILEKIDGWIVKFKESEKTIAAEDVEIKKFEMDWRERLFDHVSNPNIAYIFMLLGIYGLIYELANPGAILPGVIGGICLLLAFFAFQTLPINTVGLLLIIFGVVLLLLEIVVPSFGVLTAGGAVALFLGSIMLIDTAQPALKISIGVILPAVIATVLFAVFAVGMGIRAQWKKVTTGQEGLAGNIGEALEDFDKDKKGKVFVAGEYWIAITKQKIAKGQSIKVLEMKGMNLVVEPHSETE